MSREAILERLLELATAVKTDDVSIKTAVRNRSPLETDKRPAIVLLDGDETNDKPPRSPGRGGMQLPPAIMTMSPELFVLLDEKRPSTGASGTRLNAYRDALIQALAGDTTLLNLLGGNGRVQFRGMATDLKSGSSLSGEMRLDFAFTYVVNPASPTS